MVIDENMNSNTLSVCLSICLCFCLSFLLFLCLSVLPYFFQDFCMSHHQFTKLGHKHLCFIIHFIKVYRRAVCLPRGLYLYHERLQEHLQYQEGCEIPAM